MTGVRLEQLTKVYRDPQRGHDVTVLQGIDLRVGAGEFLVLVGPSGCGKSTLLRLIAGLDEPTTGTIWVGDRVVNGLPPKARDIAMVFQSYALYPHLTVYDNLAFGLRRNAQMNGLLPAPIEATLTRWTRSLPKGMQLSFPRERMIHQRVMQIAQMLQIGHLLYRYPKQLSGGQKQRVALGRAMARNPQVFLMDEPLSNLDAKLRTETRAQIVQLQQQLGITTIYVTHDQTEAMTMGDRIVVLHQGQIQQIASPLDLYQRPANRFVAEFIGSPPMNFLAVTLNQGKIQYHHWQLSLNPPFPSTAKAWLGIRPEHFALATAEETDVLPVQVDLVEALGHETGLTVHLCATGETLRVRLPGQQPIQRGDRLYLRPDPQHFHFFDEQTGQRLEP
ncbi:ABC transporter ATP-binding protein [Thermosynechococcus sp. PP45]|uniref:ABC transporter ATP-binding protein n=1 Tax=unclassified Thermosynechococcus TaxID=2622553 RepID=UPI0026723A62|nr:MULTISPECIES: ABC transporter ATP-binding protein [unclassified Thermosynechococcus]WKT80154.1 ABC transporter ATP-binding protein [Thermosynechococcus sp. PP45]WNC23764.1 ABC transporter ATP-binding protein [Thermosynechococcus sp. PP551]WNC26340.1 ABC transporter ATP-binding protein [Thermosynechococcus sp. PP555]